MQHFKDINQEIFAEDDVDKMEQMEVVYITNKLIVERSDNEITY